MAAQQPGDRTAGGRPEGRLAGAGWRLGRGASAAARVALAVARWALAAASGETGRRVGRAVALTMALAVLVVALYDRGEVPSAAAQPAVGGAGTAGGPGGAPARRPDPRRRQDAAEPGGLRGRTRPAKAGQRPADVAAAWYAARHGLPGHQVRPLQQDKVSAREVRVLVLADPGRGRLRTALVRVRLTASGWRVR